MTLAFLGHIEDGVDQAALVSALTDFASTHQPVAAKISGKGSFDTPDGEAVVALIDAPALTEWRQELVEAIESAGATVSRDHGYSPHITLAYVEPGSSDAIEAPTGYQFAWNTVTLAWGDEHTTYPLVELHSTDAAKTGPAQTITKAVGDWQDFDRRVLSYEAKAARKMDRFFKKQSRVIAATIRSRRGKSLQKAVGDFFDRSRWDAELADDASDMFSDVVDSFGTWTMANLPTAKKFDATHERVTKYIQERSTKAAGLVNETTEAQLRASIDALEAQGLGVDDIAKGIEDYFEANGADRADVWARTEVVGSSNYAGLEAARQSDIVSGKRVLTAEGADEDCTEAEASGVLDLDDDSIDLPIHPQCRCTWLFETNQGEAEQCDE